MAIQLLGPGGGRRVVPVMNVTPLVDVVLVLLIIFMVMTPLMTRVLSVHVPAIRQATADRAGDEVEPQVVLKVDGEGQIHINGQEVTADRDLPDKLRRVFAARADQTLFFDAADEVPYARAVEVLDLARGTGLATIAVLTEPLDG